jgi:hypothetical protein
MLALLLLSPQAATLTNKLGAKDIQCGQSTIMITTISNWFLSLPVEKAIALSFFIFLVSMGVTFYALEWAEKVYQWIRRQYDFNKFADEFEDKDDPYALLSYAIDPMKDDIHVEHAKYMLGKRAALTVLDPSNYTCFNCAQQQCCPFAFDAYNMDGDCLATK